ncbi:MAG: DUF5320 domain-containing protein [Candidatus Bathyarchaeota archaeon]|nr:DUF5320 domain-containing protein [Candidatus Bathyarchaeota archaeon]
MPWGYGYRGRGNWPGAGPYSNLPPWQRPGWLYGRGACWRLYGTYAPNAPITPPAIKPEDETALLAEQKALVEEQLKTMQETLNKIQERLKELNK